MAGETTESQIVEDLVGRAAQGDQRAQTDLLKKYWKLIEGVIRVRRSRLPKQVKAREDTEDQLQNVAIHLLGELEKHSWTSRRAFIAWMKKLTDAKVIDAQRRASAKRRDAAADTGIEKAADIRQRGPGVETQVDNQLKNERVQAMLDELKPEYATAVRMHYMGFTHPEIAEALDCPSEEAARKLVARGLAKLQRLRGHSK